MSGGDEMGRFAVAVAAVASPVDLAARPRLEEDVVALVARGVSREVSQWWFGVGKACAGVVIDETQCDTGDAGYATAAVMYARVLLGQSLDDTDAVVRWASAALAWDAGRRGVTLARSPLA